MLDTDRATTILPPGEQTVVAALSSSAGSATSTISGWMPCWTRYAIPARRPRPPLRRPRAAGSRSRLLLSQLSLGAVEDLPKNLAGHQGADIALDPVMLGTSLLAIWSAALLPLPAACFLP